MTEETVKAAQKSQRVQSQVMTYYHRIDISRQEEVVW